MKKIIALLLQVILILSIAACSAVGRFGDDPGCGGVGHSRCGGGHRQPVIGRVRQRGFESQHGRKRDNPTEWGFDFL